MTLLGELALWIALAMAIWGAGSAAAGVLLRRVDFVAIARGAAYAAFVLAGLAALALVTALAGADFSLRYVATYTSANLPVPYRVAAAWAGHAGSALVWVIALSAAGAALMATDLRRHRALAPWTVAFVCATLALCAADAALAPNPFEMLSVAPVEGRGLNPRLQHPAMIVQPPALYLGLLATALPCAVAIAGLAAGRPSVEWMGLVRRWSAAAWCVLTVGMVLGLWWSYTDVLRHAHWPLDPVANGVLLPWISIAVFQHCAAVHDRTGRLRNWAVGFVAAAFLFSLRSAAIVRNGIVDGVLEVRQGREAAALAAVALLVAAIVVWLLLARRDEGARPAFGAPVSREAALVASAVVLAAIGVTALLATFGHPVAGQTAGPVATGSALFRIAAVPMIVVLLFLVGAVRALPWGGARAAESARALGWPFVACAAAVVGALALGVRHAETIAVWSAGAFALGSVARDVARKNARGVKLVGAGAAAAHVGLVLGASGLAAGTLVRAEVTMLAPGQSVTTTDPWGRVWTFTGQGVSTHEYLNSRARLLALRAVSGGRAWIVRAERRQYFDSFGREPYGAVVVPGIIWSPAQDVYVSFAGLSQDRRAAVRITFAPLVSWVWIGGGLMALGALALALVRVPPSAPTCAYCGAIGASGGRYCSACGRALPGVANATSA